MKIRLREKLAKKHKRGLRRHSLKLSIQTTLFVWTATVGTSLNSKRKLLITAVKLFIPCKCYDNIETCSFGRFFDASKGDYKRLIKYGYNVEKAKRVLSKLVSDKIDKYGLIDGLLRAMLKEADKILMESEALRNPRRMTAYLRMKDQVPKIADDYTKVQIASKLSTYYKDKDINLEKMSIDSVMLCFEAVKNGDQE